MKSLFLFALFIGLSLARYQPKWVVSHPFNNLYKPTKIIAKTVPMVYHENTVKVCGAAHGDFNVSQYHYDIIGKDDVVYYSGSEDLTAKTVKAGKQYCFNYKFLVPSLSEDVFTVRLTLEGPDGDICAIDVSMAFGLGKDMQNVHDLF